MLLRPRQPRRNKHRLQKSALACRRMSQTIMQPASSMVSKMPSISFSRRIVSRRAGLAPPPAPATCRRISAKPRPSSQMPRYSAHASDSARNNSPAPTLMPSAASEVARVGVPSGAATTLVPMPTTTADVHRRQPPLPAGCRRASSPRQECRSAISAGNVIGSEPGPQRLRRLLFAVPPRAPSPAAKPSVAATAGDTSIASRMLLARLPRGAIHGTLSAAASSGLLGRHEPDRPAFAARARASASALVEPMLSKAASR